MHDATSPALIRANRALADDDLGAALDILLEAVRSGSTDPAVWSEFASVVVRAGDLESMSFEALDTMFALCLAQEAVSPRLLGPALAVHLKRHPVLAPRIGEHAGDDAPNDGAAKGDAKTLDDPDLYDALSGPTARQTLELCVVPDLEFEALVANVRRTMVVAAVEERWSHPALADLRLVSAVARQCHYTGYVHAYDEQEVAAVEGLAAAMAERPMGTDPQDASRVALLAAYVPLLEWDRVEEVARWVSDGPADSPLRAVVDEQVFAPSLEAKLRPAIPSLSDVTDPTSRTVRAMYEDHPYPRWNRPAWHDPRSLRALLEELFPDGDFGTVSTDPVEVLVAGCGTGSHPIATRMLLKDSTVIGLDLSRASLAFATRKVIEMGLEDIGFIHGDILDLVDLDASFDLIEALGVLHHMADPEAGWRSLLRRLKPRGFMRIGLYSERARRVLVELRDHLAQGTIHESDNDLRDARHRATEFLRTHPRGEQVLRWRDYYSLHEFRDLALHPQEHRFTPAQIAELLERLELDFIGFAPLAPAARERFLERFPEPDRLADLSAWDAFEEEFPDTFLGMLQFWVRART